MTLTSLAPASLTALRTQSTMGRPQIGWRTLGVRERIRVPWPAASMTASSEALSSVRLCQLKPLSPALSPMGRGGHNRRRGRDVWQAMTALLALGIAAMMATACAASPLASATPGAKGKAATSARTNPPSPTGAKGGSPPPTPGVPAPFVGCAAKPTGGPMVLIGQTIYDVTDPVHPVLLCRVNNTVTHLCTQDTFTYIRRSGDSGTEVVLHSMGSGNESVIAGWPIKLLGSAFGDVGAWTPDGNEAATAVAWTDGAGNQWIQIWLFSQPATTMLFEFPQPLTDCICRFGVPGPTLAFSPDGHYLVFGWPVGKGALPLRVYRVADQRNVADLDPSEATAIWDRSGHRLYASGRAGTSRTWTP